MFSFWLPEAPMPVEGRVPGAQLALLAIVELVEPLFIDPLLIEPLLIEPLFIEPVVIEPLAVDPVVGVQLLLEYVAAFSVWLPAPAAVVVLAPERACCTCCWLRRLVVASSAEVDDFMELVLCL